MKLDLCTSEIHSYLIYALCTHWDMVVRYKLLRYSNKFPFSSFKTSSTAGTIRSLKGRLTLIFHCILETIILGFVSIFLIVVIPP